MKFSRYKFQPRSLLVSVSFFPPSFSMSAPVIDSDTPFSKGRASGHHTHSLSTPEEGRGHLKQYRAEIAEDMAYAAVLAEKGDFCDQYFPVPSNPNPNKPKPVLDRNPFEPLGYFRGSEAELSAQFVSGSTRVRVRDLVFQQLTPYGVM